TPRCEYSPLGLAIDDGFVNSSMLFGRVIGSYSRRPTATLDRRVAAVHEQQVAVHEIGRGRGKEDRGADHVLRKADTTGRHAREARLLERRVVEQVSVELRPARRLPGCVDVDAGRRPPR